jgi:hypothetical protein
VSNLVNMRAMSRMGVGRPIFPGNYTDRPPYYQYRQTTAPPNYWDRLLAGEIRLWRLIQAAGGIKAVIGRFKPKGAQPSPSARQAVQKTGSIALPAADGLDHVVLAFLVPSGYFFEITSILHFYTGNGFVEGSGDLAWRLMIGNRYAPSMGDMLISTQGAMAGLYPIQEHSLIAMPNELIQYFVNFAVAGQGNLAGGRIVCQVNGYFYPRD